MARTVARGELASIEARVRLLDQLALVFMDDPDFLALLDGEVVKAYEAVESAIPVRTGTLRRALTNRTGTDSNRRAIVRRGRSIVVRVDHPGAKYIPNKVLPNANLTGAVSRALTLWRKRTTRRQRVGGAARVAGRRVRRLFGRG